MNRNKIILAFGGLALLLGLTGCDTTPQDIEEWKAKENTKKLISALDDHRQFMRVEAIEALLEMKSTEAIDPLATLFHDLDQFIAHKAIDAVAAMEDPSIEKHMIELLGFKTSEGRTTAATALGKLESKAAVDPLITALGDSQDKVVAAAATALGRISDSKAIGPLSKKTCERSFDVRMASVTALVQLGGDESAPGLALALGDINDDVRNTAKEGLVGIGSSSTPLVLDALRSESHFARGSGVAALQGLNAVPSMGSDEVWYQLAMLTASENPTIDLDKSAELAVIEDNMDALLEAASHNNSDIRDYASLALEAIGKPAVAAALATTEQCAPHAKAWFDRRSKWCGAPAWQIDLWAATTLLKPKLAINMRIVTALKPHSHDAEQMMRSKAFIPHRQYIPMLIAQFSTLGSENMYTGVDQTFFGEEFVLKEAEFTTGEPQHKVERERVRRCRRLAEEHLIHAGYHAFLPLTAALDDEDLNTAAWSARTLVGIDHMRAEKPVVEAFESRVEKGEELSGTPLHTAMQDLGLPTSKAVLRKVRPDKQWATAVVERKYPDIKFRNIPLVTEIDPGIKAAPFTFAFSDGERKKILKVVFRPNETGDWVPFPPLPDTLPK